MDNLTTTRTGLRLPAVDPHDVDSALDHIISVADGAPAITLVLSNDEAHCAAGELGADNGPLTHWETLRLIIPIVETLFDEGVAAFSPAFHAQLAIMLQFPLVPESAALQVAFGRGLGETALRGIERLVAAAHAHGVTVDEHVADRSARGELGHDLPSRSRRGETHSAPDAARTGKAVDLLRVTAAYTPEPLRPPVLCTIAWLLWAEGKRALALAYLREAVAIEPEHVLARSFSVLMARNRAAWTCE